MGPAAAPAYVSLEDCFEAEVSAAAEAPKHEWFDGVVYAMSRGTPEHGRLTSRATIVLGNALPADCQVYSSETMLFIEPADLAPCADVTVVCGMTVRIHGCSVDVDAIYARSQAARCKCRRVASRRAASSTCGARRVARTWPSRPRASCARVNRDRDGRRAGPRPAS